jgi:hypothetical protein
MKIENSTIGLASQHASSKQITVEETLRAWVGQQRPDFGSSTVAARPTVATLSATGLQAAANAQGPTGTQASTEAEDAANQVTNDPRMQLLIGLIEALTGQKVRLFDPSELNSNHAAQPQQPQAASPATSQTAPSQRQGWGVEYDKHETLHETELTTFNAAGVVKTSDGKEIRFQLALEMKREFFQESSVSVRKGDAVKKDPLVINFNGTAAQLTNTKFAFDLNTDGKTEQISFVGAGSGFLTLDKNGNGIIDNGSELFGAQSGNGFTDLSAYDSDGNQWIDENDAVYSKLRIWSKDVAGKDTLSTLAQRNVGALYLGNLATSFDLKNSTNDLQGQVRNSGIYLHEDGSVGTLQQIDLVV